MIAPHGRDYLIENIVAALSNRLRVTDYVQHHPEVREEKIERPVVILGMPRTGTTVISYLLDCDPARRSLLHWEPVHPVPPATTETLRTDPRCLALLEEQKQIVDYAIKAKMPLPHWEDADGPTEDMFLHAQDFKGLSWDSFLSTSRYAEWLIDEADMTSAYEYQKLVLADSAVQGPRGVEPQDAFPFGTHRHAAQGVPRRPDGVGPPRPVQSDRVPVQPVQAAEGAHGTTRVAWITRQRAATHSGR